MLGSFRAAVAKARRDRSLLFAALLSEESILEAFGPARWLWQGWIYSPAVTVWVFLSQCLSTDHSCRDAVARLIAWRVARGLRPCSADTGAYCTARDDLPEAACRQLVCRTGRDLEARRSPRVAVAQAARARGRRLHDHDAGHGGQPGRVSPDGVAKAGLRFSHRADRRRVLAGGGRRCSKRPSRATKASRPARTACSARSTIVWLAGDVVLFDRYFSGWFDLALLSARGVDVVVRKHQLRDTDFRKGQRLGAGDQLVCWRKPRAAEVDVSRDLRGPPRRVDAPRGARAGDTERIPHERVGGGDHPVATRKNIRPTRSPNSIVGGGKRSSICEVSKRSCRWITSAARRRTACATSFSCTSWLII